MSKVSRADWAATTPWDGITSKPTNFGVSDIGQLTGKGYGEGQVPAYDSATRRFRPHTIDSSAPAPVPTPTTTAGIEIWVIWDVPSLHALQTATEDFYFVGAFPSMPVIVGTPFTNQFVQVTATVTDMNLVRISVTNMDLADLDLGEGTYRLRLFNGV